MKSRVLVCLMTVGILTFAAGSVRGTLVNASFEDPYVNPYAAVVPTGWNWSAPSMGVYTVRGDASSGAQFAEVNAGLFGLLWQNTGLVLQEGYTYTLSFDGRDGGGLSGGAMAWYLRAAADSTDSGATLVQGYSTDIQSTWGNHSVSYTATAADTGMYLAVALQPRTSAYGSSGWADLDNVVLTVTPEPMSIGLLVLGGLLGLRRGRGTCR